MTTVKVESYDLQIQCLVCWWHADNICGALFKAYGIVV